MKISRIFACAASAALLLCACEEQVDLATMIVPESAYEVPSKEEIAQGVALSLTFACPEDLVFAADDSISVFSLAAPDTQMVFKFVSQAEGKAVFSGQAAKSGSYCAIYPWTEANKLGFVDGDGVMCSLTTSIPAIQPAAGNANVYVAMADTASLSFEPICAKISIPLVRKGTTVTGGTSVTIVGLDGESLSGVMTVTLRKGAKPQAVASSTGNASRTINTAVAISSDTSYVEMLVAPQRFARGYKVTVLLDDATNSICEIEDARSVSALNNVNKLNAFEYVEKLPDYYVDFKCATMPTAEFTGYKVDIDPVTLEGRIWLVDPWIPDEMFKGRTAISEVTIPAFITKIGKYGLQGMTGLTKLTFEEGSQCELFDDYCLADCSALTAVKVPAKVKTLGKYSLRNLTEMTSFTFEDNAEIELFDEQCLVGFLKIGTIPIPASVKKLQNPGGTTKTPGYKTKVYVYCKEPPIFNGKFANGVNQLDAVYIPKGTMDAYVAATDETGAAGTGWSRHAAKFIEMDE